jgi:hypothetical protein
MPPQILLVFPLVFALVLVCRWPALGLYALLAAALVIPTQPLGFPDSLIDNIPFFVNLSGGGSLNVSGLGITPAEILMGVTLVGVIGGLAIRHSAAARGRLTVPYLVFGAAVLLGEVNGLVHGGDFKLSLWELRPQAYGLALFAMGSILIKDRTQLKVLVVVLLVSEVLVAVTGDYRYFVTLGRQEVNGALPILAHEDSYLLGLFAVAVSIGLVWFRRPLMVLLVALSIVVLTAMLVNHRRAGSGALAVEIATVVVLAYVLEPSLRKSLIRIAAVGVVLGVVFLVVFWNQQYGTAAEIVRPVKSIFDPSARDLSSDLYRVAESANLKATFRASPVIGIGFGHPYYIVTPQTGVAKYDPLWNIIPHNNILWIPMRMGIVGMIAFWSLISTAIIQAIWVARNATDKFIRAVTVFAAAAILGVLFTGYYDIGIENYRNMIVVGLMLAVINRAEYLTGSKTGKDEMVSAKQGRRTRAGHP